MKKLKTTLFLSFFFSFFFIFKHSFCLDPWFELCVPKNCGDGVNITYPFFIHDLQNSSCGYPGFHLTCSNNSPMLRLSGNDFKVKHMDPKTHSVRLQYTAALSSCPSTEIKNLTLDPNRFIINNSTTSKIVRITRCENTTVATDLDKYRIRSCQTKNTTEFVMVNDGNMRDVCGGGGEIVEMPVELDGGETVVDGGNYLKVAERGFVMTWRAADCGVCEESGGRCGFDSSAFEFRCLCADGPRGSTCKPEKSKPTTIIILVVVGCAIIFALATGVFLIHRAYKRKALMCTDKSRELEDASVYFGVSVFSYAELQDATNHFDSSKELGDGGFGTVYYGKLRDGREVAVKRLYEHNYKRVQQFMNEVEILTRLRHKNLVSLYGCTSRRSRELLLVYEYIPNGTVADHLHGDLAKQSPLTWQIRMKIAIETASALVYLHASEIIHRDVKTNNILLDTDYCVKVADFGLSRLLPNDVTHVSTAPQGTPGYVDPEYYQCFQLTDKSDVYSFGVVLIELISSMPALDISRSRDEIVLANMAINRIQRCALNELIDPFLASDPDTEKMTTLVAELAFRCLQFDSETRPTMVEVLEALKVIRVEESGDVGNVTVKKSEVPPPSPENEGVGLLKGPIMASPVTVTAKWHSTSSESITPNAG
ncbi:putative protein kinase RLK-Pelle-WAK-LRK10L-1 family [Helianthus debilis subsp. tardiflorus]